jgi:hypothetical protein
MSPQITLGMLKGADTAGFPVIELDDYVRGEPRALDNVGSPIACLPSCCRAVNPAKYPPFTYGEYRVWWLNNNYRAKLVEA